MVNKEMAHKEIWLMENDLRGDVDGWDFKQYIFGIMFYRYISENLTNYINELENEYLEGDKKFDYAKLEDEVAINAREEIIKEKGFFIMPSELFENVCKRAKNDENLNKTLERIFNNIEGSAKNKPSEGNFSGLFGDIDVNSNKLGATVQKRNEKLVKILEGIANINIGTYHENNIDAFGDAYEYLMQMYASGAGKSGGEFYTPQEVSELLTKISILGKEKVNKVYDPACGSGSLLLKAAKILGKENIEEGLYGQEINVTTYNLCRINMFLHNIGYEKFNIKCEDTLLNPKHDKEEPFDVIISDLPYSIKWEGSDNPVLINDVRYSPAEVLAPKSKADLAFIMHSLAYLTKTGVASIICFPSSLYKAAAEQRIRKYLIDNNFIDAIIQLPENLFFSTTISKVIIVLKKTKKENDILFIDASKETIKVTNNNKLTEENIQNILNMYKERKDIEHKVRVVDIKEIEENNYNLSVSRYVEPEE